MSPTRVHVARDRGVELAWPDGVQAVLTLGTLRRACPCAECRSIRERPATSLVVLQSAPASGPLAIAGAAPVGNYAMRIECSDGHDAGIYTYELLRRLSESTPGTGQPLPR